MLYVAGPPGQALVDTNDLNTLCGGEPEPAHEVRGMGTNLCALALAMLVFAPGTAAASGPPDTVLLTDGDSREGSLAEAGWSIRTGWECVVRDYDGEYGFPGPPVRWVPGTEIVVRFETRQRPRRVEVGAFLLGDPTAGVPIYGKTSVPHELRRVEIDGKTMWEAVLSPPPWPDLYLEVMAEWKDPDGCDVRWALWKWRAGLLPV